jgi:hypothetical protein
MLSEERLHETVTLVCVAFVSATCFGLDGAEVSVSWAVLATPKRRSEALSPIGVRPRR